MLCLDTSGSMRALDFEREGRRTDRLQVVREVVKAFIKKRNNDRIGMVVFGEQAFTQCPLTMDYGVLLSFLDRIEIGYALDRPGGNLESPGGGTLEPPGEGVRLRPARGDDLAALVEAARASLREENRPDPFEGDPDGFRRWVAGRVGRATIIEWQFKEGDSVELKQAMLSLE